MSSASLVTFASLRAKVFQMAFNFGSICRKTVALRKIRDDDPLSYSSIHTKNLYIYCGFGLSNLIRNYILKKKIHAKKLLTHLRLYIMFASEYH